MLRNVDPTLRSKLKYLNNRWMDCHGILYRCLVPRGGSPLTLPLALPASQSRHLSSEIYTYFEPFKERHFHTTTSTIIRTFKHFTLISVILSAKRKKRFRLSN